MTILFHNLAIENKIVLFYLPSQFTYLTRLLDVRVFQLSKHYYTDEIDKAVWFGDENFGKLGFLFGIQYFAT